MIKSKLKYRPFHWALLSWILLNSTFAYTQLRIEVELRKKSIIPENPVFLVTDFDEWNPGDTELQMHKMNDSIWYIELQDFPEKFEYKFTQGNWMSVEGTPAGESLPNRIFVSNGKAKQYIRNDLLGWEDKASYTIIIRHYPENTPKDARIYIAGNFNNWATSSESYRLKKQIDGSFQTKIYTDLSKLEFKFTRGDWERVESRASGKARPNRVIFRSSNLDARNIEMEIEGWEDLNGTFSFFSFFDLLLLFSVFQGVLLIFAIPAIQSNNRSANKWLILTIALSSLMIFLYVISNYEGAVNKFPLILFITDLILFTYAPLYYFYLRKLLFISDKLPGRWYLHFIPFLIQLIVYAVILLNGYDGILLKIMNQNKLVISIFMFSGLAGLLWNAFYWNLFRKNIRYYEQEFRTNFSFEQNLNYLNTVLIIQFITLLIWAVFFIILACEYIFEIDLTTLLENFTDLIWLCFSAYTYILGYFAIAQPETFKAPAAPLSIFDDILEGTLKENNAIPDEKEENSEVINRLEKYMQKNKPYVNPGLTLNELAKNIEVPSHQLSKLLNDHFGKNFFDFINSYRIQEFKKLAADPKNQHFTFLGLAYEVGFNSKTAFNRSFKKITGQTPREFLEENKELV